MTKLLQKAFDEASKLPESEQDALGRILLDELAAERCWEELFTGSQDLLAELFQAPPLFQPASDKGRYHRMSSGVGPMLIREH